MVLFSELPSTAFVIHTDDNGVPFMWADKTTRKVYSLDRIDVNLINVRDFTTAENHKTDQELAAERQLSDNSVSIGAFIDNYIETAIAQIGLPSKLPDGSPNPALIAGTDTMNAMLAYTNSAYNTAFLNNPASFMKPLTRWVRKDRNATIAMARALRGKFDSADVGPSE